MGTPMSGFVLTQADQTTILTIQLGDDMAGLFSLKQTKQQS
jgi:hypothetical protein